MLTGLTLALLSACGGGGGGGEPPPVQPPVTPLPDILSVSVPNESDVASPLAFSTNVAGSAAGLKFSWSFGDGSSSTEAAPRHAYAKAGDYDVVLKLSNEAGASREATLRLSVNNMAHVKGLQCSGGGSAAWCWQRPTPTGSTRRDVFMLDAQTAWMVGAQGEIFKTTDAGGHWVRQASGQQGLLNQVRFIDPQRGWVLGDQGLLLRTVDGGKTWIPLKLPSGASTPQANLHGLGDDKLLLTTPYSGSFVSTDGGGSWLQIDLFPQAVSSQGVVWSSQNDGVYRSTDLGVSRARVLSFSGPTAAATKLKLDGASGVLVGRWVQRYDGATGTYISSYTLYRSDDGGQMWQSIEPSGLSQVQGATPRLLQVSGSLLVLLQGNTLMRSSDGGRQWQAVPVAGSDTVFDVGGFALVDAGTLAYCPFGGGAAACWISEDAALTWRRIATPDPQATTAPQIQGVAGGLWMARSDTAFYLSSDKGRTWTLLAGVPAGASRQSWLASWFFDSKRALLLNASGELHETLDGGLSWRVKAQGFDANLGWSRLQFLSATVGYLVAGGQLWRTVDGGQSWASGTERTNFAGLQFIDERQGLARRADNGRALLQTSDGGQHWTALAELPIDDATFTFVDSSHGWVGGFDGRIHRSSDGGKTWTPSNTGSSEAILRLVAVDARRVLALTISGVLASQDGGVTWTLSRPLSSSVYLRAMHFSDAQHGWVVGSGGAVAATSDGGKTWVAQDSGSLRNLTEVQFVDSKTGWILGEQGTILATGTGGR